MFDPSAQSEPSSSRRKDKDRDDGRRSRSRREPVEAADLGARRVGKESKDSFESQESLDSGRPASRSSKDGRRRRREGESGRETRRRNEGEAAAQYEGLHGGSSSTIANNNSRQLFDPRRDDPVRFTSRANPAKGSGPASLHSFASSAASIYSTASGQDAHAHDETASANSGNRRKDGEEDPNSFVSKLRKAYREITEIEQRLQDEHKATLAAQHRDEDQGPALRIQGGSKRFDDGYWVRLALAHKQLADAHYSFLQLALDSKLPPSTHSLPLKYNIPTRLWQTGFHQLLERMRHAVTASPLSAPSDSAASVLEHLIEFIQYAYGFYSQLFEDPSVGVFRPAWIEQLGDLARYRMAVAGLASRVAQQQQAATTAAGGNLDLANHSGISRGPRPLDAASIGEAAMGDWELEEQETWRDTARDWYGQGVAETPGTGRLQHHLALLSKGDEMRGLYHYAKSLCATHPYLSARESILPLFEDEHQARRTQPDVSKTELFVHLHGMLFTKIQLDDFDDCLGRFVERIGEEAALATRNGGDWSALGKGSGAPFGDAEWFMVAVTNISALLQYGQEDGIIRSIANKDPNGPAQPGQVGARLMSGARTAPQAIMLNSHALRRDLTGVADEDDDSPPEDVLLALAPNMGENGDRPLQFVLAKKLTFNLLDVFLRKPYRKLGDSRVLNPYIILVLTFLGYEVQRPAALRELEREVPWQRIIDLLNSISDQIDVRLEGPIKLTSGPLPEDWCIRGMDWTGRHLFGRGYWKPTKPSRGPRDEMDPGRGEGGGSKTLLESEADALKFDLDAIDDYSEGEGDVGSASAALACGRWRRVATLAAWFVRFVPGFDFDPLAPHGHRFSVTGPLEAKLAAWVDEDRQMAEAEKASSLKVGREADLDEDEDEDDSTEEEDDDDENDSAVVRELKGRRRQLKAVIRQAKLATRHADTKIRSVRSSGRAKQAGARSQRVPNVSVFAGHTVLVFDTNILLSSMKLFRDLVEREKWTIIVPLAVVTELDGLKRNASPLGMAAVEAISYLETAIRCYSRFLKVQTSRGNYLRDLSIRNESIDFNADAALSSDAARSMDDVILRAVAWQRDHFQSRLSIVNPRADRRAVPADCAQVVLVSFDGNLRLKARARGLEAVDEKGMARLLDASEQV